MWFICSCFTPNIYGYPLYSVRNYYDNGSFDEDDDNYEVYGVDIEDAHIVVKLPNGKYMDADGVFSKNKLIDLCIFTEEVGEIKIEEISEFEAISAFLGCDFNKEEVESDINEVIDEIKSKSK